MSSIKSDALEPTRDELQQLSVSQKIVRLIPVYGLVFDAFARGVFSLLLPDTFPTSLNIRSIIANKSIIAILSLAAMIPMVVGRIGFDRWLRDCTLAYFGHLFSGAFGMPWPLAVLLVIALGAVTGAINGVLVEVAKIDAFIATLGTGTVIYAIASWYTGGAQVVGVAANGFYALSITSVFGLPITGFYVLIISVLMWLVLEFTPVGRFLYAIGANQKAAELNGIPSNKYIVYAFVASGTLTAIAGVLLAAQIRIGQSGVGLEFLLPALVGAFLGSTTSNQESQCLGTVTGVIILAVGISGIQQLGGAFWVEPLFNGATLLVAIGIAGYAQRKRGASSK